jgi:hypothetical protein
MPIVVQRYQNVASGLLILNADFSLAIPRSCTLGLTDIYLGYLAQMLIPSGKFCLNVANVQQWGWSKAPLDGRRERSLNPRVFQ